MDEKRQARVLGTITRKIHQIKEKRWKFSSVVNPEKTVFVYWDQALEYSGQLMITIWSDGRCEVETEGWFDKYQGLIQEEVLKLNQEERYS